MPCQVPNDLVDAFVIEDRGNPSCSDIQRDAVPNDDGLRMIDFKSITVQQRHGERLKRTPALESLYRRVKGRRVHRTIPIAIWMLKLV